MAHFAVPHHKGKLLLEAFLVLHDILYFQASLTIESKAGTYQSRASYSTQVQGKPPALLLHNRPAWQNLSRVNTLALFSCKINT
jgi:hypothetical protein